MIKLFRNIRQNLLNEGKTSKYLKYAFGEIILVVIGILIALQINNWNENRNISSKEIKLLSNVKNDLERDIITLKRQDSFFLKKEINAELGLDLYYKAKSIKDIDSVFKLSEALWNELFINQNTYKEMINSGSMYTLKNTDLQKEISKYYNSVEAHIEYIRGVNTTLGNLWELDPAMYPIKLMLSQIDKPRLELTSIDTTWINNPKSKTYLSVSNYLHSSQNLNNIYRREVFQRFLTAGDTLLIKINKEIKNRLN